MKPEPTELRELLQLIEFFRNIEIITDRRMGEWETGKAGKKAKFGHRKVTMANVPSDVTIG